MTTVYKFASGLFQDLAFSDRGTKLPDYKFTKLHPLMSVLDAAADEDGDAYVKGVGTRTYYPKQGAVRYDFTDE